MVDLAHQKAVVDRVIVVDHMQVGVVVQDGGGQFLAPTLIVEDVVRVAGAAEAGQEGVAEEGHAQDSAEVGRCPGGRAQDEGLELAVLGQKVILGHIPRR